MIGVGIVKRVPPSASTTTKPPASSGTTASPGAVSTHLYSGASSGAAASTIDSFTSDGSTAYSRSTPSRTSRNRNGPCSPPRYMPTEPRTSAAPSRRQLNE